MTRETFYVGARDKHVNIVSETAWDDVDRFLVIRYDGFTRFYAYGAWRAPDGHILTEPSRVYVVLHDRPGYLAIDTAGMLATMANQTCVLWTVDENVTGGFAP